MKIRFFGIPQESFSLYERVALFLFFGLLFACGFFEAEGAPPLYLHAHAWLWFWTAVAYCAAFGRPLAAMGTRDGALTKQCIYYLILIVATLVFGFISIDRLTSPPLVAPCRVTPTTPCPGLPIEGYYIILTAVVSAMVLGLGWLIQFSLTAKAQRRQHTIRVLLDSRMSSEFQMQMANARAAYGITDVISAADVEWCFGKDSKNIDLNDPEQKKKYLAIHATCYLLNFYEFLAVGIEAEDLDEKVLKDVFRSIVINLHLRSVNIIAFWQAKKSSIHSKFVAMTERWSKGY